MPSIIPAFEYDIFISYRHNDNRSGWVTEFVKALQEELAATIKEPLTIYFDKNPHDGLLETHNVDKSLEGKLKCLIFIPIISQTYCDTKSFAWEHEFCAFNKLAKEDQLGRDIKLSNGNVASRILPIKIHDLDLEDKTLLESELGGVLRAIEFIYKEAGVNRPLKSADNKNDNQCKTDYRNQVNKVANAIKEIITALKNPTVQVPQTTINEQPAYAEASAGRPTTPPKNKKVLIASFALLFLLVISYFLYQQRSTNNQQPTQLDKSIAVLPFENMSGDATQEYFSDGISEEILNSLAQIEGLKVTGRTSSFQFKGKGMDLKEVGEKLGVATILEGSIRKQNDQLRITVQLVSAKDGYHLWSERFDRKITDVFAIQDEIAQAVSSKLKLTLLNQGAKPKISNQAAYDLYLQGRYFLNKRGTGLIKGLEYFKQAVALDSTFAQAYSGMANCYVFLSFYCMIPALDGINESKKWAKRAITLNPNSAEAYGTLAILAFYQERDWPQAEALFKKSLAINPNDFSILSNYGHYLQRISNNSIAAEKQLRIAINLDPLFFISHAGLALSLTAQGKNDLATDSYKKAIELNVNSTLPYTNYSQFLLTISKPKEAISLLENNIPVTGKSQAMLAYLCEAYAEAGKNDEAKKFYNEIHEMKRTSYVAPFTLGMAAVAVGKLDEAFKYYNLAYEQMDQGFHLWNTQTYNSLKFKSVFVKDPRYKKIMDQLAFPKN